MTPAEIRAKAEELANYVTGTCECRDGACPFRRTRERYAAEFERALLSARAEALREAATFLRSRMEHYWKQSSAIEELAEDVAALATNQEPADE